MSDAQTELVEETQPRLQDVPDWDYLLREFELLYRPGFAGGSKIIRAHRKRVRDVLAAIIDSNPPIHPRAPATKPVTAHLGRAFDVGSRYAMFGLAKALERVSFSVDKGETIAIKEVFGEHAYKVDISSTKSMLGHMLGGAGAIETMICARTITEGVIAPTINLHTQDPECDLNYTPLTAKQADVRVTLSNSFGFGGHNACIMLRRYDDAA